MKTLRAIGSLAGAVIFLGFGAYLGNIAESRMPVNLPVIQQLMPSTPSWDVPPETVSQASVTMPTLDSKVEYFLPFLVKQEQGNPQTVSLPLPTPQTPTVTESPEFDFASFLDKHDFQVMDDYGAVGYKKIEFSSSPVMDDLGTRCLLDSCYYYVAAIDLSNPHVSVTTTRSPSDYGQTVADFVRANNNERSDSQIFIAFNGDEWPETGGFTPFGLHIYDGQVVNSSSSGGSSPTLYFFEDGTAKIAYEKDASDFSGKRFAISGMSTIVVNGKPNPEKWDSSGSVKESYNLLVPRAAVGVNSKRDYVVVIVTDAVYTNGYQTGLTLKQMADWMLDYNIKDAFTLSSGGAGTMIIDGEKVNYTRLVSGDSNQVVSNAWGFRLEP